MRRCFTGGAANIRKEFQHITVSAGLDGTRTPREFVSITSPHGVRIQTIAPPPCHGVRLRPQLGPEITQRAAAMDTIFGAKEKSA